MRKLIVSNMMSLDGYYEGPGKRMSWPCSTTVGRSTRRTKALTPTTPSGCVRPTRCYWGVFHTMASRGCWLSVADDPNATPIQREISRLNNTIGKVVISDTLTAEETEPWHNTRIIGRADAHEQLAELKGRVGRDVLVFGSRMLWSDLLANDLVDELHLMIRPVVLGAGTSLFDGQPAV